ncbi:MAG TPA: peptidoglycan-binding protein, partial [Oxalobacteraceae bacterium]|nr:peptidoglycan-binding protein [Oxalobacteraceae bacterium]
LMSIARRLSAKPANWAAIGKLNRIAQDSSIPIGSAIFIPADMLADEPSTAKVVALAGASTVTGVDGAVAPL